MTSPVLEKSINSDSYVLLYNVSWEQLGQLDIIFEDTGARLTYLDGILEITPPPSEEHEEAKKTVTMLIEAYLRQKHIRFYMRGSATIGKKKDQVRFVA